MNNESSGWPTQNSESLEAHPQEIACTLRERDRSLDMDAYPASDSELAAHALDRAQEGRRLHLRTDQRRFRVPEVQACMRECMMHDAMVA